MRRSRTTAALRGALTGLVAAALLGCPPSGGSRIGDANGDGRFDDKDLGTVLAILTSNDTDPNPASGPALADVARPCGGPLDEMDMRRLRASLAAAAFQPPLAVDSQCHEGGEIGQIAPNVVKEPALLASIDEGFARVADQVPGFAGAWVEDGSLVVALQKQEQLPAALEALAAVFGTDLPEEPAVYKPAEFAFRDLMDWNTSAGEAFYHPDVTTLEIDERANRVKLGLSNLASRPEISNLLTNLGIPPAAVIFDERQPVPDLALVDELRTFTRPLRGGVEIGGSGTCTMSLVVRRGGVNGFLTNSHCTAVKGAPDSGNHFQPNVVSSTNFVGVEMADSNYWSGGLCPASLCTSSDAAYMQVNAGVTGRRGVIRKDFFDSKVTTENGVSFVGQNLRKVGRTTGLSVGEVEATCVTTVNTANDMKFCQDRVEGGGSGPGDSGSPVYRHVKPSGTEVSMHGILWGGPPNEPEFWFTPMGAVETALGAIDTRLGEEPPQVTITNPTHGSSLGAGNTFPLTLTASFFDFEDGLECALCEVVWVSDVDGPLGTSTVVNGQATLGVELLWPGGRWIYATASDNTGAQATDAVYVVTSNSDPSVQIVKPGWNENIVAGNAYILEGTSFDTELFSPLPCASLQWSSPGIGAFQPSGCMAPVIFQTPGDYMVTLTGTDPANGTDTDQALVHVVPGPSSGPPTVTILSPLGPAIQLTALQLLSAYGNDPDDQSPIQYEWVLRAPTSYLRNDIDPSHILGSSGGVTEVWLADSTGSDEANSSASFWLPSNHLIPVSCTHIDMEVEVRATDANAQTGQPDVRQLVYLGPPC